jgi:hypothetical protein
MKIKYIKWCGEGDLFSLGALKTRNLYTLRSAQSSKRARNTKSSHTFSHTGLQSLVVDQNCDAANGPLRTN